ncbi:MAG: hypothetical protein U0269_02195 [Polyangiales bacterium]
MIDEAVATRWRRLGAAPRARALRRLAATIVARRDALSAEWSARFSLDHSHCAHFEVPAVAAALDELAHFAPLVLDRSPARRWFFGESVARRDEAPDHRVVLALSLTSPAAIVAWCATALAAGTSVRLVCDSSVEPAFRAVIDCIDEDDALPIELSTNEESVEDGPLPRALERSASKAPGVAWVDDDRALDAYASLLVRAASYANGDRRGALRYVYAREATAISLRNAIEALAPTPNAPAVRCLFADDEPAPDARALVIERCADEYTFVARARQLPSLAYACGIGADPQRARSLALRSGADSVFVNSSPAEALGGLMRVDFDPIAWLSLATRSVSVAHGPTPSIAHVQPSRVRWLRRLVGITLGRYGIGGVVDDLW